MPATGCVSPAGSGGELKSSSRLTPGETKPPAAAAAVSSRAAAGGARWSARKALAAPSLAGDLPYDSLPPDASIVVVRRSLLWLDGDCLVFYGEHQSDPRRCADPLVADDAFNVVAMAKEELGHSRRNSRHRRRGVGTAMVKII